MLRKDSTAIYWSEQANIFLTTADFSPPQALAAAKLALAIYQRSPSTHTNLNLAKTYAAIAEGYYLSSPQPELSITKAILYFVRATQAAFVDDSDDISRRFNDFLNKYSKTDIFEALKKIECKKTEMLLQEQCTFKKTNLGAKMHAPRWGWGTECDLTKGTLNKIYLRIKELKNLKIIDEPPIVAAVAAPANNLEPLTWLQDAISHLKNIDEKNKKAALIYATGALLLHTPTDSNKIEYILIHHFRGVIHEQNENLMAAINDMNKALELLAESPQNIEQCHAHFKRLSQQNTIETLADHFYNILSTHFAAHILDAIKANPSPTTIRYLMNICLNRDSVMGRVLLKLDNGLGILDLMRIHVSKENENAFYNDNSNLFGSKNNSVTAKNPVKQITNGTNHGL